MCEVFIQNANGLFFSLLRDFTSLLSQTNSLAPRHCPLKRGIERVLWIVCLNWGGYTLLFQEMVWRGYPVEDFWRWFINCVLLLGFFVFFCFLFFEFATLVVWCGMRRLIYTSNGWVLNTQDGLLSITILFMLKSEVNISSFPHKLFVFENWWLVGGDKITSIRWRQVVVRS